MITSIEVSANEAVQVLHGLEILEQLGEEFDALAVKCGAPVTARRLWLEAWIRSHQQYQPVAVGVQCSDAGLSAVALFGIRSRPLGTDVVALGHGASDQSRLYAVDTAAARHLALAVKAWLQSLPHPWRMTLAQLPSADAGVGALRDVLQYHMVHPAPGSPVVIFQADRNPGRYLTTNYRGQAKNKWNRMMKHGLEPKLEVLISPEEISAVLPRVMEIAGIRQAELTGRRKLDQSHHAVFFTDVVLSHASRDEVELMLLRIGGEIGAYSLTFLDGKIARMWSSHYHPRWSEYSPGHILSRALVERCLERHEIDALDWMKGLEPYKLRTANHVEPAQSLQAWSGLGGRSVGEMSRWIRTNLSKTRERYPALRRLQIALRQWIGRRSATDAVSTEGAE